MGNENDAIITARIPLVHDAVLGHLAKERGVNRSDLIREAVADLIAKRAKDAQSDPDAEVEPEMTLVERAFLERVMDMREARSRESDRLKKIFKRIQDAVDDADYYWKGVDD